jgi:hypothetical protein
MGPLILLENLNGNLSQKMFVIKRCRLVLSMKERSLLGKLRLKLEALDR